MFFYYHTLNSFIHAIHSSRILRRVFGIFTALLEIVGDFFATGTLFNYKELSLFAFVWFQWERRGLGNESSAFKFIHFPIAILIVPVDVTRFNYRYLCELSESRAEVALMLIANCQMITGQATSSINSAIIIHYVAITSSDGNAVHLKNRRLSAN